MPSSTFFKLPVQKQEKIVRAARKELNNVPFEKLNIKNIVEEANIPRGSFYAYFHDKDDLLAYLQSETTNEILNKLAQIFHDYDGNIFKSIKNIHDSLIIYFLDTNQNLRTMFKNLYRNVDVNWFSVHEEDDKSLYERVFHIISWEQLKISNEIEAKELITILFTLLSQSLIRSLHHEQNSSISISRFDSQLSFLEKYFTK